MLGMGSEPLYCSVGVSNNFAATEKNAVLILALSFNTGSVKES